MVGARGGSLRASPSYHAARLSPLPSPMRLLLAACFLVGLASAPRAQNLGDVPPRFGVGFDVASALWSQDLIPNGPALGIRGRVALPVNADISLAASLGIAAHLFEGRDDARTVLNPQASLIVTLPGEGTARYLLGGFGAFLPLDQGGGGPTIHAGAGWAIPLNQTSVYFEIDPSLVVGEDETTVVASLRAGVIF